MNRIGIFRALQLGDLICTGPAFKALRAACPDSQITLIGLPWARSLLRHFPNDLDNFLEFPGYPGLKEREPDPAALPSFLNAVQREEFDLVIQLHGNGVISNPLVSLFGARQLAGYYQPGSYCPDPKTFLPYPGEVSEVWRHLRLMEHLGFSPVSDALSFHLPDEHRRLLPTLLEQHGITGSTPYVCLHPGTRAAWRCWPPASYATLGNALAAEGYTVVFTGSTSERPLTSSIIRAMEQPAVNLAGETADPGLLAALLANSRLLVCGDTGVSHLACAVGCPSVVIFMRSEREGWPPADRKRHRVVSDIRGVTVDRVLIEAFELLAATPEPAHPAPAQRIHQPIS